MEITILNTDDLQAALGDLGLPVAFFCVDIAPSVINYHFNLENPLDLHKTKKIVECLSAYIHKPIKLNKSKKASFCLSIPRDERDFPTFAAYNNILAGKEPGEILFGINDEGQAITRNIRKTKSMLVAGSSGGGKSVCLHEIICSIICYTKPEQCGLVLIDLKRCEFELYKNSNHLVAPVQFDYDGAVSALEAVLKEIENRYKRMQEQKIRDAPIDKLPLLVVVIDEYAELASQGNKTQLDTIVSRIATTGYACNVFLILATQHAVSSIISNTIKSNLQTRIGLRTSNIAQSSCILGTRDCVDLLGYGDSFISFDGVAGLQRIQVCYISEEEINYILKDQNNRASMKRTEKQQQQPQTKQTFWQKVKNWWKQQTKKPKQTKCDNLCIADDIQALTTTNTLNYADCVVDDDDEN